MAILCKINKRIILLIMCNMFCFQIQSQIIQEIRTHNVGEFLDSFTMKIEKTPERLGCFLHEVITKESASSSQYDFNLKKVKHDENKLFIISATTIPNYNHFLILFNKRYYIVNMRNPLDSILFELSKLHLPESEPYKYYFNDGSFDFFLTSFLSFCQSKIKEMHKKNWFGGCSMRIPEYLFDEDGFETWIEVGYDPKKW